jgi:alpha-tubulin suppressor-like RCC1 family protein
MCSLAINSPAGLLLRAARSLRVPACCAAVLGPPVLGPAGQRWWAGAGGRATAPPCPVVDMLTRTASARQIRAARRSCPSGLPATGGKQGRRRGNTDASSAAGELSLDHMTGCVLLAICAKLRGADLARLEAVARHFVQRPAIAQGKAVTLMECAAELRVRRLKHGWRAKPRDGEDWKYTLWVLECRLSPLPEVSTNYEHALSCSGGKLAAWGLDAHSQLGLGDSAEPTERDEALMVGTNFQTSPQEVHKLAGHKVISVAAAHIFSVALTDTGALLVWGWLGYCPGDTDPAYTAVADADGAVGRLVVPAPRLLVADAFPVGTRVALVVTSEEHILCTTSVGEVFSWGLNDKGELGHGDRDDRPSPQRVDALAEERVVSLSCNKAVSAAVTVSGALFIWGKCFSDFQSLLPKRIQFPDDAPVRFVSCGKRHMAAIGVDGVLFTWGQGGGYWLGHRHDRDVDRGYEKGSHPKAEIYQEAPRPVEALSRKFVVWVSCGKNYTAAVTSSGKLYTWGGSRLFTSRGWAIGNKYPFLGHLDGRGRAEPAIVYGDEELYGPEPLMARQVCCGADHTVVAGWADRIYTFGEDYYGTLGTGKDPTTHVAEHDGNIAGGPLGGTPFVTGEQIQLRLCSFVPRKVLSFPGGMSSDDSDSSGTKEEEEEEGEGEDEEEEDIDDAWEVQMHLERRKRQQRRQGQEWDDVRHVCFAACEREARRQGRDVWDQNRDPE